VLACRRLSDGECVLVRHWIGDDVGIGDDLMVFSLSPEAVW